MKEAGKKFRNRTILLNLTKSCPELSRDIDIQIILKTTRKKFLADFSSSNVAHNKRCPSHFNSYDFHATCFFILLQEVHSKRCAVIYSSCTAGLLFLKLNKYWQI